LVLVVELGHVNKLGNEITHALLVVYKIHLLKLVLEEGFGLGVIAFGRELDIRRFKDVNGNIRKVELVNVHIKQMRRRDGRSFNAGIG